MKLLLKNTSLTFKALREKVLAPVFNQWASSYFLNNVGDIRNVAAYTTIGVSEAISVEGYSKLRVTGCAGITNQYACICSFWKATPAPLSTSNVVGYQRLEGQTSYEVNIPSNALYVVVVNAELSGSSAAAGSNPVYTLVP